MKNIITLAILLTINSLAIAQPKAYLNYSKFFDNTAGSYIETYLAIEGNSVKWKETKDGKFTSNIEVTLKLWRDTTIISFSKKLLEKTVSSENIAKSINLIDISRLVAQKGNLRLTVKFDDLFDTLKPIVRFSEIEMGLPSDSASISSILPILEYSKAEKETEQSKNGLDLIPRIMNFIPKEDTLLTYYAEVYNGANLKEGDDFLLLYYIKNHESGEIIPAYNKFKRMVAKTNNIILNSMDISRLPTGNFTLNLEIRSRENKILASTSYFFQRENPTVELTVDDITSVSIEKTFVENINSIDTLAMLINCIYPISNSVERNFAANLLSTRNKYYLQQYLFHFWSQRNSSNPVDAFNKYMMEVAKVQNEFGTKHTLGFTTDRGRVYLQYGPPNSITKSLNEPNTYPYEIWHYYNLGNQSNRKFIFYNSDLSSKNFYLLHSDAIGEINNYQWRIVLHSRNTSYKSIDDTGEDYNEWGGNYNEYYSEPH